MATLIVLALSNALSILCTAWVLHRAKLGLSPLPMPGSAVEVASPPEEPVYQKGRPIL